MTRKDYVAIAAAIKEVSIRRTFALQAEAREHFHAGAKCAMEHAAKEIAIHMERDNPRFDRERFLRACGVAS